MDLSFLFFSLVDAFFLLLALDLAVVLFVLGLLDGDCLLVLLVLGLESVLGGGVDVLPHVADDLGDLGDLGGRVVRLHSVVDFAPVEEEGREGPLGGGRLPRPKSTLSLFSFLPIIYKS